MGFRMVYSIHHHGLTGQIVANTNLVLVHESVKRMHEGGGLELA